MQLGSEEYYGGGNTLVEAKQAAAMQVRGQRSRVKVRGQGHQIYWRVYFRVGGGNTLVEPKQAAAMQVCYTGFLGLYICAPILCE